jgi:hypothetical protein
MNAKSYANRSCIKPMQRTELAHVLRASAEIAQEKSFVLIGSQAVLLLLDNPPAELLRSSEIDLYPSLHPEKSDLIDGAIGALSTFHDTYGYHADGVSPETVSLPVDWMRRAVFTYIGDVTAICPAKHPVHHITQWAQRRAQEATA